MIASVSRSRRPKLFPICRVKRCRSVATETLSIRPDAKPFFCQKCLRRLLSLEPDR